MGFVGDEDFNNEENTDVNATQPAEEKPTEEKPVEEQAQNNEETEEQQDKETEKKPTDDSAETHNVENKEEAKNEESQHKEEHADEQTSAEKIVHEDKKDGHLLMPNDSKIKFVQDSFGFSNEKTTFEAPKFHPYLLMKDYTVQYMDPIIKKAKPKRCLCC